MAFTLYSPFFLSSSKVFGRLNITKPPPTVRFAGHDVICERRLDEQQLVSDNDMSRQPVTHIQGATESRRSPSQPSVSAGEGAEVERTDEASPSEPQEQLFDAHIRRLQVLHSDTLTPARTDKRFLTAWVPLQANVEAQSQQVKEAIQPLQDTKKSLVKVGHLDTYPMAVLIHVLSCCVCARLRLEAGEFSEPAGRGGAAEEGTGAQALEWARVVPPAEEGGGARDQAIPRGGQEAPELVQRLPPTLQLQGDATCLACEHLRQ